MWEPLIKKMSYSKKFHFSPNIRFKAPKLGKWIFHRINVLVVRAHLVLWQSWFHSLGQVVWKSHLHCFSGRKGHATQKWIDSKELNDESMKSWMKTVYFLGMNKGFGLKFLYRLPSSTDAWKGWRVHTVAKTLSIQQQIWTWMERHIIKGWMFFLDM